MKLHKYERGKIVTKLTKDEKDILFYIYTNKFGDGYEAFIVQDLVDALIKKYNHYDVIENIISLSCNNFIALKQFERMRDEQLSCGRIKTIFGGDHLIRNDRVKIWAPDSVEKHKEMKKILRTRICKHWLLTNFSLYWLFIWKHFIVTIVTAALTAYVITTYITPPS